ncbi:hypothetical protein AYL99_06588 [Fonsecaea erecta]|uniref:Major facilitator superfamily (MFS) profile domain-containing protein n=1 Tax=Fonsecaea erecta TaxID=1367422 RepID=A0A178ZHM9_9EURO|nr:hypothetical protein AYL99_06588 [Fonsecaea erecta]OAP59290.1 hypothetical protein AYL99_06588 [Fonsecaea erecta]
MNIDKMQDAPLKRQEVVLEHEETVGEVHLVNPLQSQAIDQVVTNATTFAAQHGLEEYTQALQKGALLAQHHGAFNNLEALTAEERNILQREAEHKWHHPSALYRLIILCSIAAAVNGMDLVSINGANIFFPKQFGIDGPGRQTWILGLVNSAPYFCCTVFSVWLTAPLNRRWGRRGVMFVTAFFCFAACIWSACTNTWWHLMIARIFLGIGLGPKSATLSVYAAECAPARIRGALTMCWQIWVAFGIMLGTACNIAFYHVPDRSGIVGLNWRLMLGIAGLPALVVMAVVYTNPESPRWLMLKGRYREAFKSLQALRGSDIQAARDLYYIHVLLEEESKYQAHQKNVPIIQLFTIRRNRNAVIGSSLVMFAQQYCGINVMSYYSTNIFSQAGASPSHALLASWGFGMLNFIFAFPAVRTIDTFGRRKLLLCTFPLMTIFLLMAAGGFYATDSTTKMAVVAVGVYLYVIAYSPGEGPVPFVYSAEAFPLAVRDVGMSFAVFVCWGFNSIVGLTFPSILDKFTPPGAFFWYAGWNALLTVAIYLFLPETKALSLEELDVVFDMPMATHAAFHIRAIPSNFRRYILRQDVPKKTLYSFEEEK